MKFIFILIGIFLFTESYPVYLLKGDVSLDVKRQAYQEVLIQEDYPCCLMKGYEPSQKEVESKLKKIDPKLEAFWVPTSLFQLFVLHSYFSNDEFRKFVQSLGHQLGYNGYSETHPKINIDEDIIGALSQPKKSLQDIFSLYHEINQREKICNFFIRLNDAFCKEYSENLLDDLLKKIPTQEEEWKEKAFPFLFAYEGKKNIDLVRKLFSMDQDVIRKVIEQERMAREEKKHLLYRGAEIVFLNDEKPIPLLYFPLKAKRNGEGFILEKGMSSFSLSYSQSLFGGIFFSTDGCAARYAEALEEEHYAFHALKLDNEDLSLFCIPPLHPFAEMLVDGEWFHPHAKIASKKEDSRCWGWYAPFNRTFVDHMGFLIRKDITPEELCKKIIHLAKSAIILNCKSTLDIDHSVFIEKFLERL